jgi:hypothetical protein
MEKAKQTVTVYKKTTKPTLDFIENCRKTFLDLSIFKINLGKPRENQLDTLLNHDTRWLEFVLYEDVSVKQQLNICFQGIQDWMDNWRTNETAKASHNAEMLPVCDNLIDRCYVILLAILMHKKFYNFQDTLTYAQYVYSAYKGRPFAFMVYMGKKDFYQQYCWPVNTVEIDFSSFINELNTHFYLFFEQGINRIFQGEIKKDLGLQRVPLAMLERIFSFMIGSFDAFRRFINRNYLYSLIDSGLGGQGVDYGRLNGMQNHSNQYEISITNANFAGYAGMKFFVDHSGIPSSRRYIGDHLITFGKDSAEEFTNDISLPNTNDLDSIFAIIFINHYGLNLIDISELSTVKIKLEPGEKFPVKDDMVVVLAKSHQFVINFFDGLDFGGNSKSIKLSSFGNCKTTATIGQCQIMSKERFTIGSSSSCDFQIKASDVKGTHAIISKGSNGNFFIEDNESNDGTFYRLKTKSQIDNGEPSEFITLNNDNVFQVKFFTFLIKKLDS